MSEQVATIDDISGTNTGDYEPCLCDGCGKDMRDPETGLFSICTRISRGNGQSQIRQFGQFKKSSYSFCYECCLKAHGARE